ncbi:interferon-induced protein 44-like [Mya arenaria]|uniref:interferon-induced protein 44-like n=1 Tax=Mya arenaria TaxID=6604 RepID=UPI0022DF073E|nr:interferon-induced protein 44-like [Mya arenaria]XP_052812406.1 interferon-induced protein 44-like [Mya arenaria]XP_052812407.1 interferon-induced protein 44-like [Mya arenaria]XP_052812408.1 interferon-induced protein 44-like [Mya arenaria]XP_052812409.1 interferon-induced protein 44-like [Mya arenaria]
MLKSTMSSGRLTQADRDQLETWIGGGPKVFHLLYNITKDSCDTATFHQRCDNQGPTVTVLYNPQGSVYAGFASVGWEGSGIWSLDNAAFLFHLKLIGSRKCNKFPAKLGCKTVLSSPTYGPVFGYGGDLHTFHSQPIPNKNGVFKLNGNMGIFGTNFDAHGLQSADINNGTMDVTELEVYKVTDGVRLKTVETQTEPGRLETAKCWRKTPDWNQQLAESLCKELGSYKCPVESNSGDVRILLLGPVGSGKSGFVNTVQSAFSGRLRQLAPVGNGEQSITTQFKPYRLRTRSGGHPNLRLCDIPGMERRLGLDITDLGFLLDGNVPEQYTFNPCLQFTTRSPGFVYKPPRSREVHCVALVVDTSADKETETVNWLKTFTRLVTKRGIPLAILLTKIDLTFPTLTEDLSGVFKSQAIETKVNKASSIFGVPRNNVWPVKNYENEDCVDDDVTILSLLALQRLVHLAEDYIEGQEIGITERDERGNSGDHAGETVESDTAA